MRFSLTTTHIVFHLVFVLLKIPKNNCYFVRGFWIPCSHILMQGCHTLKYILMCLYRLLSDLKLELLYSYKIKFYTCQSKIYVYSVVRLYSCFVKLVNFWNHTVFTQRTGLSMLLYVFIFIRILLVKFCCRALDFKL